MRRVLVHVWGKDGNAYVGRAMKVYRDPKVLFGGVEVGGIRISHMSHIDKAVTMALTMTRANKKPFTVQPLALKSPDDDLLDRIVAALEAAPDAAMVRKITLHHEAQHLRDRLRNGKLERLTKAIADAEARTAPPPAEDPAASDDGWPGPTPEQMAAE
jgi:hypothetical protein